MEDKRFRVYLRLEVDASDEEEAHHAVEHGLRHLVDGSKFKWDGIDEIQTVEVSPDEEEE